MSMDINLIQNLLGQFIPKALDFISVDENRKTMEFLSKATDGMPVLDAVEVDEDNQVVYIKIKLTPKIGVNIYDYADAVDKVSQKILELISSFLQETSKT